MPEYEIEKKELNTSPDGTEYKWVGLGVGQGEHVWCMHCSQRVWLGAWCGFDDAALVWYFIH